MSHWYRSRINRCLGALLVASLVLVGCSEHDGLGVRHGALGGASTDGRVHRLIHLDRLLDGATRRGLVAADVRLLARRGDGWWSVSAPARAFADLVGHHGVDAVRTQRPDEKIAPALARALDRERSVTAWVMLAFDVDHDDSARHAAERHLRRASGGEPPLRVGFAPIYQIDLDQSSARAVAALDVARWLDETPRWRPALDQSRISINVEGLQDIDTSTTPPTYKLAGQGTVGGVWDPDGVDPDHKDLNSKALRLPDPKDADSLSHGTSVSGCMLGDGSQSNLGGNPFAPYQLRGIAPAAKLVAYLASGDRDEKGQRTSFLQQYREARERFDIDVLSFSFSHQGYAIYGPSAANLDYVLARQSPTLPVPVPIAVASSNDGYQEGYGSVSSFASAKNIITVGGTDWATSQLWGSSGFGPTADGRVKPEVLAPGCASHGNVRFGISAVRLIPTVASGKPTVQWTFERDGDAEGWKVVRHLDEAHVSGGQLWGRTTSWDPGFIGPDKLGLDAKQYTSIEIDLTLERHHRAEIFWKTDKGGFHWRRRRSFLVRSDGKVQTIKLDLSNHDYWKDTIEQIRIDPVVHGVALTSRGGGYSTSCGTSYSTPMVAGGVLLMTQAYRQRFGKATRPPPSLYRALLAATARDFSGKSGSNPDLNRAPTPYFLGADHPTGFGEADIGRAVAVIRSQRRGFATAEVKETGHRVRFRLRVHEAPKRPLVLALAWDDPAAEPASKRALQNDLDLSVRRPDGTVELPWQVPGPSQADQPSPRGFDRINNIEQLALGITSPGDYVVFVRAHELLSRQVFSLALSDAGDTASLTIDADGDGAFADVDCDDSDPDVHPYATEVLGNGKDDDCDASTPDTPPQPDSGAGGAADGGGGGAADGGGGSNGNGGNTPEANKPALRRGCAVGGASRGPRGGAGLLLLLLLLGGLDVQRRRRRGRRHRDEARPTC